VPFFLTSYIRLFLTFRRFCAQKNMQSLLSENSHFRMYSSLYCFPPLFTNQKQTYSSHRKPNHNAERKIVQFEYQKDFPFSFLHIFLNFFSTLCLRKTFFPIPCIWFKTFFCFATRTFQLCFDYLPFPPFILFLYDPYLIHQLLSFLLSYLHHRWTDEKPS